MIASKGSRVCLAVADRWGARFGVAAPNRLLARPLGLIHADVKTAGFGELFKEAFPADWTDIVVRANQALEGKHDLLGSGIVDSSEFLRRSDLKWITKQGVRALPIGRAPSFWHFDFKSGIAWDSRLFFSDIRYGHVPGADVKVPWELSRCAHLVTVGQAYALTGEERYADYFVEQVRDWVVQNPVKRGVNWACPMDIGLRAANWIFALDFFHSSQTVTPDFLETFSGALWAAGDHIRKHLEWSSDISSNHYLANLIGLGYIGATIGESSWLRFAVDEMEKEMEKQVYPDGLDYEGSLSYHRLVLELFFFFVFMIDRSGTSGKRSVEFGSRFLGRLRDMFEATQELLTPSGRMPMIGDNDSGRVHVLRTSEDADHRYLMNMGALFFKDHRLKVNEWEDTSEVVWLFGFSGRETLRALPGRGVAEVPQRRPGDSGLPVLRGENDYLCFAAQPNGTRGIGNHTHNDKLSFVLSVGQDDFFIDPGTGVYTPDAAKRNLFRSTRMHNTVEIDGEEQNRFRPDTLFALEDDAKVGHFGAKDVVEAFHTGYRRLPGEPVHRRKIERRITPLMWIVTDKFEGHGRHRLVWRFNPGREIRIEQMTADSVVLRGSEGALTLRARVDGGMWTSVPSEISPSYGVILPNQVLEMETEQEFPFEASFSLIWHAVEFS